VATLEEGVALRRAFEEKLSTVLGSRVRILVLGSPVGYPKCFDTYLHNNIELMVSGPEVASSLVQWMKNHDGRRRAEAETVGEKLKEDLLKQNELGNPMRHGVVRQVSMNRDKTNEDGGGWNNNPLIVRRRNSLLVSVRRGYGAIMFYFKSVTECKEFCDELVLLNRDLLTPKSNNIGEDASSSTSANDGRYVNGMNKRELHIDEMIGNKRNRSLAFGDNDIATQKLLPTKRFEYDSVEDKPAKVEEIQQCQRQEEMMSYITKLAHSEEFRGFVHELERGLDSSVMP